MIFVLNRVAIAALTLSLGACSVLEGDKINYRSATKGPGLEVPPDLSQLTKDTRYVVPGSAINASSFQNLPANSPSSIAAQALGDTKLERSGNQQWLVINRAPDKVWDEVRDFWLQSGFVFVTDQATLGILETDWAENRAKIPQDIIRATLGKVLDTLYSSGEQDKFRTRLERNATGGTDLFISHRGMTEVYTSTQRDQTKWQARPNDPELEAEFLKRLMLRLGGASDIRKTANINATVQPTSSKVTEVNGQPVIEINDGFDRAWRRVGLSLDRTGFTVEDRDRAKGMYFVRYVDPGTKPVEPGFISKILGNSGSATPPLKLRVMLSASGSTTTATIQTAQGTPTSDVVAKRIVAVLAADLK